MNENIPNRRKEGGVVITILCLFFSALLVCYVFVKGKIDMLTYGKRKKTILLRIRQMKRPQAEENGKSLLLLFFLYP